MRKLLTLLCTFSGLTVATFAYAADGVVDITWGTTCTPIVTSATAVTAPPMSAIVSELGNDQTHKAYQVRFLLAAADRTVPDAWRFDAAGCQGTSFITMNHLPPASAVKTCPAFQGTNSSIQIKDYSFVNPGTNYPQTTIRGVMANTYPAGFTTLATQRYFLAQFLFDHQFSVNGATTPGADCGGFENAICIALLTGPAENRGPEGTTSFLLMDGTEVAFQPGNTAIWTGSFAGCPATPTQNKTWGQIKSQYHN